MEPTNIPATYEPVVVIDKLAAVWRITALPQGARKKISQNIKETTESRSGTILKSSKKAFKQRYFIPVTETEGMLIEYQPTHPDKAVYAMRIEFNPNKIGAAGCDTARSILNEIFGEHSHEMRSRVVIDLVDWCLDFPGLSTRDVIFRTAEKYIFSTWGKIFGKEAELETLYEGSPTSSHQIRGYDKRREVLSAMAKRDPELKIEDLESQFEKMPPCMRVEARTKHLALHLSELNTLKNPFQNLEMYSLPRLVDAMQTDFDRLFLDSIRLNGLGIALRRIKDIPARRRYARAVAKYRIEWWEPERLGSQLAQALQRTRIFPDSAFERTGQIDKTKTQAIKGSHSSLRPLPHAGDVAKSLSTRKTKKSL